MWRRIAVATSLVFVTVRALAVLGLSPDVQGLPTDEPSQSFALWLGVGVAAVVLAAGAALFVHRRRGSERA